MKTISTLLDILLEQLDAKIQITAEHPRLEIIVEGESENGTECSIDTEYQLETKTNLQSAQYLIKQVEDHRERIIGWKPHQADRWSEDLEDWETLLFEESLIPVLQDDRYCDKITDIRIYLSLDGARLPIRKKKGKDKGNE